MDIIKKIQLDDDHYIEIGYDTDSESPRKLNDQTQLCIRKHRRYDFPNELDIDLDDENVIKDLDKDYYVFELDCYEHSGISFSLKGTGMQCRFDTSNNVGIICVQKDYCGTKFTEEEAKEIARSDINLYNQYLNGEVYRFVIYQTFPSKEIDGIIYHADHKFIDSCSPFYEIKDIVDHLDTKYHKVFLDNIS